ncbi:hypothetical protein [Streptomyces sp. 184]
MLIAEKHFRHSAGRFLNADREQAGVLAEELNNAERRRGSAP